MKYRRNRKVKYLKSKRGFKRTSRRLKGINLSPGRGGFRL
nr:MAG: hypothetical protein [Microvirus sp.]